MMHRDDLWTSLAQARVIRPDLDGRACARRLLEAALAKRSQAKLAEVFLKTMKSVHCVFGMRGVHSMQLREESGVALRVWDTSDHEGFVHADGCDPGATPALVERAWESAGAAATPSLIPRLPGDRALFELQESQKEVHESGREPIQELARGIISAFSRPGQSSLALLEGRIEMGWGGTWIVNSRGGDVGFPNSVGALVVIVRGARDASASRRQGTPVSTTRYTAPLCDAASVDFLRIADEACWRAAASIGGEPASGKDVPILLDPRAAARWLRTLTPFLVAANDMEHLRHPSPARPSSHAVRSGADFHIVDNLERIHGPRTAGYFDGEGRRVLGRFLVRDGRLETPCFDSRDPQAPEGSLGPMRRDSFRDLPSAGPMSLCASSGVKTREQLLEQLERGLFVTNLGMLSAPGAATLVAEVKGIWIERGHAHHPVAGTLLVMPAQEALDRIVELGCDPEVDEDGPSVMAPSLALERADLVSL